MIRLCVLLLELTLAVQVLTEEPQKNDDIDNFPAIGPCPKDHPWAYMDGMYCCKHDREHVYPNHGPTCDGGRISKASHCCKDFAYVKCPYPESCTSPDDWELVAKDKECDNADLSYTHSIYSVSKCAEYCRGKSTMFVYQESNNNCGCPLKARGDGTCRLRDAHGRTVYKYSM